MHEVSKKKRAAKAITRRMSKTTFIYNLPKQPSSKNSHRVNKTDTRRFEHYNSQNATIMCNKHNVEIYPTGRTKRPRTFISPERAKDGNSEFTIFVCCIDTCNVGFAIEECCKTYF